MDDRYQTVYVALSVAITAEIAELQRSVCQRFELIARPELHITFGFLGVAEQGPIDRLGKRLAGLVSEEFGSAKVLGLGGATQDGEGPVKLLRDPSAESWRPYARVLWWAVEKRDDMVRFRDAFIAAAIDMGMDSTYLRPGFSPHVTLGSNGPQLPNRDWSLWDVHTVDKEPSLGRSLAPAEVPIEKLHITSVPLKAESLHVIRRWR